MLIQCFSLPLAANALGQAIQPPGERFQEALNAWDAVRSGPLIAIDPARVSPHALEVQRRRPPGAPPRDFPVQDPLPPDAPLMQVVEYCGRKLVRFGSLSAVVPVEMKVLNTKLGKPDILSDLPRDVKVRLLAASLSPGQWRQLGGPNGIGMGDLNRDQQSLFLSILPDPFTVIKCQVKGTQLQSTRDRVTLAREERSRVRLRLDRMPLFSFAGEGHPNAWISFNDGRPRTDGQEALILEGGGPGNSDRRDAYGAELASYLPNAPKPSDLRYDSAKLDAVISLSRSASGLTVEALIKRIAASTGLELYVDPRAAAFPVWTAGSSARAGEVLRALTLAVTGTFRKVGPAYVLTDDLQGIGPRVCKIDEWTDDAGMKEVELLASAKAALESQHAERHIGFGPGTSLPVSADRLTEIAPSWSAIEEGGHQDFALGELDSAWQTSLREEVSRGNAMMRNPQREHTIFASADRVRIRVSLNLSYLVAGLGTVDSSLREGAGWGTSGGDSRDENGQKAADSRLDTPTAPLRALHVAPASAADAARLAAEAKQRDFTQLWIELPDVGAREILESSVNACREQGIAAVPVVRTLYRLATEGDKGTYPDADLNSLGESSSAYQRRRAPSALDRTSENWRERFARRGDWLRIDTPEFRAAAAKRVTEIASVPGIAAIALRDTAPPGYLDSGQGPYQMTREGWDFGLTPANRLDFLRQQGTDPIDVPMLNYGQFNGRWELPFFPSDRLRPLHTFEGTIGIRTPDRTIPELWNAFRYDRNREWLAELFRDVRMKAPTLPMLVQGNWSTDYPMIPARFVHWEKADGLPDFSMDRPVEMEKAKALPAIVSISHLIWRLMPPPGQFSQGGHMVPLRKDEPAAFALEASRMLNQPDAHREGIALDLSDLPADRVIEFLRAFPPLKTKHAPPARTGRDFRGGAGIPR